MLSKVLVADDHVVTRKMLRAILEKNGYQVFIAEDGLRAWEILQAEPDVVLIEDAQATADGRAGRHHADRSEVLDAFG